MLILILGSGCANCHKLYEIVKGIVNESGRKDEVSYITGVEGMMKITELGIMSSPVIVVDGNPVMIGFLPDRERIREKIYGHI